MIKLKNILSEAYAWERQEGKPLPTLAEVQAAYQAKLREDAHNEDPEEEGHVYEEPPYDDEDDDLYEAKADKDYDGDGEIESGSEEYLGSRDKAIKAASDSTPHGNYVNKARAKSHLTKKDGIVHGINRSGKSVKLTSPSDVDKVDSNGKPEYTKFTIKSNDDLSESFNKRILGNLHGHEYILREAFKRK
jgi:hypothetical protein